MLFGKILEVMVEARSARSAASLRSWGEALRCIYVEVTGDIYVRSDGIRRSPIVDCSWKDQTRMLMNE